MLSRSKRRLEITLSHKEREKTFFRLAIDCQRTTATFVPISRVADGSLIFPRKPQRRGLLVGDSPSLSACYVSTEGCLAFYPPASRSMDFFSSDLRASTRFAECESNKLPTSENILRKFIYGRRARWNGAHCVPKTQRYV